MSELLDKHAPLITRRITCRPHAPWFDGELREAKRQVRRCERKWMKSKLEIHRLIFKEEAHRYHELIKKAKCDFHKSQLENCNSRDLFAKINTLCKPKSAKILPSAQSSDIPLVEQFSYFFADKIKRISETLKTAPKEELSCQLNDTTTAKFMEFSSVSEDVVRDIVSKSPSTSCDLDPIPTWLVKKCLNVLLPIITKIVNLYIVQGYFPNSLKHANIKPLIKKPGLDSETLKNYRPVANLKFLAKTVDRVCSSQIQDYLIENNLNGKIQSAYRSNHSTETALVHVYNDLLTAVDVGQEAVLILLDYSTAFDTINHEKFFQLLSSKFGINGCALDWFKTYFTNRTQSVIIDGHESEPHTPLEGVPQGSVIGPLSFTLYSSPLETNIESHGIGKMIYAYDTQVYVVLNGDNTCKSVTISKLELCVKDIKAWSTANYL